MALISPGLEIDIIDDSQYVSATVGTVPFVLLATAQDKTFQGSPAAYTSKATAGQLLSVSSQRDLITNLGYPTFQQSSAGTPLNGNETNEYGLMAAYSAMGVSNKMFLMRADIDLAQLIGTSVRPIGLPANGIYWLDTADSTWGIYEWNSVTQSFINRVPTVISDPLQSSGSPILSPVSSVGSIGSYAVIAGNSTISSIAYNDVFYKNEFNTWVQVGGNDIATNPTVGTTWQTSWPAVSGNITNPTPSINSNISINSTTVTVTGTDLAAAVIAIQIAGIPGITANTSNNNGTTGVLEIYVTSKATGGKAIISTGSGTDAAASLGITPGTYFAPSISYGGYVSVPDWRSGDSTPSPSGSVWFKTSTLGGGANIVIKEFNANNDSWTPIATPIYADATYSGNVVTPNAEALILNSLDPAGGGNNILAGTVFIKEDALYNDTGSFRPFYRETQGEMKIIGANVAPTFSSGAYFHITSSVVGNATPLTSNVVISTGGAAATFVSAVLAAAIPNVTAAVETSGAVSLTHTAGGSLLLIDGGTTPLNTAGLTSSTNSKLHSVVNDSFTGSLASNFAPLTYTYSATAPYTSPVDGTLWFFNSPLDVDILINDTAGGTGWKGYRNVSQDARGYNLTLTDSNGPIMSPTAPVKQSDGTTSVALGDLWINTGDLANFPVISRCTTAGSIPTWTLIDNADAVDQNGIVFADARWDSSGTVDPLSGTFPAISTLLTSNYIDLDCPDARLYPRGTLLFNLRRSGYNVKHYVSNYFNSEAFPFPSDLPSPPYPAALPTEKATWVTSSGLKNNGSPYTGSAAQRVMVVKALKAAIAASDTLREDSFQFNLVVCPGYPELISDMVELNNDRKDTAFIIGDTPMHLPANGIAITNWSTDANGDGLATADPYMGVYYPSGLASDLAGNSIVVPPSHMVLRAAIKSDSVSYPWFAFAGTRRGLVDNVTDLGYVDESSGEFVRNGLNQGMRDTLYPLAINPITLLPGVGITIFGNKTRVGVASALDRVNVSRLVNYIRTILGSVGNGFLFEPNDKTTWDAIGQIISSAMNDLVTKRAIYDYAVVCDASNNTPFRIANNELYVDIAVEPEKDIEFIFIPIRLLNPGAIASSGK